MSGFSALLQKRWPAALLVASLLLNGFLAGMLVVDWLTPRHAGFSGERFARFELGRFDERLPPAAVERVKAALEPLAPTMEERITRVRTIRDEVLKIASAPTPDGAALEAKLADLRRETAAMQELVQRATYEAVLALPPEDRARLAEAPRQ